MLCSEFVDLQDVKEMREVVLQGIIQLLRGLGGDLHDERFTSKSETGAR